MINVSKNISENFPLIDISNFNDLEYPLMEHFYTVQGEGTWTGTPAYFLRLGGCDVGCVWCDVKESWNAENHSKTKIGEMVKFVQLTKSEVIVITGGEPLMYDLSPLTQLLKFNNYRLHLETSGVYPLKGIFDWICLSPKKFKPALEDIYPLINELKIIVYNKNDLEWAEEHAQKCSSDVALFLQPEWSKKESSQWILDYIKENPKWRISIQTHKYLDIP